MKLENDIIIFNNDDELLDYCLDSCPTIYMDKSTGMPYHDYAFTPDYMYALEHGTKFKVADKKSLIMKRGCVSRGAITKRIENLCED